MMVLSGTDPPGFRGRPTAGGVLSANFATTYPPALVVKSNATPGTLSVGVNLKRPPAKGSTYTAITFGSLSGEFTSFTVEGGSSVKYTNDSVVVTFQEECGPKQSFGPNKSSNCASSAGYTRSIPR